MLPDEGTPVPLPPDDDATATIEVPRIGLRLGDVLAKRFRIGKLLGRGGMGEVFEAEDLELGGSVALKIIRPDLVRDSDFLSRFRREVQLARQVTHPNVCRIFDLGNDEDTGRAFFTMELLEGRSLAAHLREAGKLSPAAALPLAEQISGGLAALHERGIVHRDLKPGNIMVVSSASGRLRAVIGDFGLARANHSTTAAAGAAGPESQPSAIVGTPEYMSPEQLLGAHATPSSDIYAFGVTLYELVTGARPLPRERVILNAVQRLAETPKSPRELTPDLPLAWESAILRCLNLDPARRPATPAEVIEELRGSQVRTASTASTAAATITAPLPRTSPPPAASRRKWLTTGGLTLAVLSLAALLFFVVVPRFSNGGPGSGQLAVLPFQVTGNDPALRMFADSLMDSLTRRLGQLEPKIEVTPAAAVRAAGAATAEEAKAKLRSARALEGTVSSEGSRIRLEVSLTDTKRMRPTAHVVVEEDRANAAGLEDALFSKLAAALASAREHKAGPSASAGPGAHEFYLQARGYLQRTDQASSIESAIALARRALQLDPGYALAHSALGEALFAKYELTRNPKWVNEALASGRKAVELDANLAETNVSLGRILNGTGRPPDAVESFTAALAIDAASTEAHQGLGNAYSALKQYEQAEAAYRKAITLKPGDWNGYKQFGLYFARRSNWDKAIEQYKTVIELTPDNAHGYLNTGVFYAQKGEWGAAKEAWQRALALDPGRVSTVSNLAKAHYIAGEYDRAIALYRQAIKLTSTRSYSLWGNLGTAELRAGNRAAAREALLEAIKIAESEVMVSPGNVQPLQRLAYYRALIGQRNGVETLLGRALQLAPGNTDTMISAAETYAVLGNTDKAVSLAKKAIAAGIPRASILGSVELRDMIRRIETK